MTKQLDSFETELLDDLRHLVVARSTTGPAPARPHSTERTASPGTRRRHLRRASLLAVAAASAAAVVTLPGLLNSPAYAVSTGPSGTIEVEVNRLEDAAGLERALRELGVRADIQYLGDDLHCQRHRFDESPSARDSVTFFSVGDGIELRLDRRDVDNGETVVIAASRITDGVHAEMGIAGGPVSPCVPRPLPEGS